MADVAHLPGAKEPVSLATAAKGTRVQFLEALRDKVAAALDEGVPARELSALTRRLQEITRELEVANAGGKGDKVGKATKKPNERLY